MAGIIYSCKNSETSTEADNTANATDVPSATVEKTLAIENLFVPPN